MTASKVVWFLLEHALAPHMREAIMGDLQERHRVIEETRGAHAANRFLWRELMFAPLTRMHRGNAPYYSPQKQGDSRMTTLLSDLQFAWRMLWRRPAFSVLAIFTLALGIGATTAIFSVVNPILFESLPYPNADRVMMVWQGEGPTDKGNLGFATYLDIAEKNRAFSSVAVVAYVTGTMIGRSEPQFLEGDRVSASFFNVLGVQPTLGRAFRPDDNVQGAERVIIISNALWRNRFGADSSIIGKPIRMTDADYTVVGVMPATFENLLSPTWQFLLPIRYQLSDAHACRSCRHLRVVARRKPDMTVAQAERDMKALAAELKRDYPTDYRGSDLLTNALSEDVVKNVRPALLAVLGAVALVLLVACLNVMNLLLARGAQREGEFAVRAALGAGRPRIVRQLLVESILLAMLGGIAGVGIAFGGVKVLVALSPANLPRLSEISIETSVLVFALAITTTVGVVFGLVPALQASRSNLHDSIRRNTRRSASTSRLTRSTLVVSEVALALVLLIGSGLLFRSMEKLFAINPGFDAQNLLTMQIQAGGGRLTNDSLITQFMADALQSVRAQPGVVSAALTSQLPLSEERDEYGVRFETRPPLNPEENGGRFRYAVSDGYFETMKIPLVTGRYFSATDNASSSYVAIINESFARRRFGNVSPVGQRIRIGGGDAPWREIVGIVGDVRQESLSSDHFDGVYLPEVQWKFVDNAMTLVVRPKGDALSLAPSLRRAIWAVDKDQPIVRIATAEKMIADRAAERRFALVLFEGFAMVALVLAAAGIYGVLSGSVVERNRELGVRAALGATSRDQVGMVVRQGMTLTSIGVVVGLGVAFASSRVLESMLFEVSPLDPVTYAAVAGGLAVVALLACWIPARRASQTSPLEALKAD